MPPVDVELAAGEMRDIQIDARDCGTCQLELTIWIGERAAANAAVDLTRDGCLQRCKHGEVGARKNCDRRAELS
jgi:hypothetical protein